MYRPLTVTTRPTAYTIPPHRVFADSLVEGILAKYGDDPVSLARGIILLPNNRGVQAVRDAFVRQAEHGLLLPRLAPIGDIDIDARLGPLFEPIAPDGIPPAIDGLQRQLILARLVQSARDGDASRSVSMHATEAMRLAADLARTLDQLIAEDIAPDALTRIDVGEALSAHWSTSLDMLNVILDQWPRELAARGRIDLATRRNLLFERMTRRWKNAAPSGYVIAAGISTTAVRVAELLRVIARLPQGSVILAGLDTHMSGEDWDALIPDAPAAPIASHPQHHLRLLLDRMKIAREEVKTWRYGSDYDGTAARSRVLSLAMARPEATAEWSTLTAAQVRLPGVTAVTCQNPAHEATSIAIALRHSLETPGQMAALVTPDRNLAARVVAQLKRWDILADDSAGQPLSATLPGSLVLALIDVVASEFAPVELLSVLKHPLVHGRGTNLEWLDGARALDLALRGPRPAPGLAGLNRYFAAGDDRERRQRDVAAAWWGRTSVKFEALEKIRSSTITLPSIVAALRLTIDALVDAQMWTGQAGKAVSDVVAELETWGNEGPSDFSPAQLPDIFRQVFDAIAVRPEGALHPRIAIWGLLEAKLQTADVMILGGLNEGVWPSLPAGDPWLAPKIRRLLGLPTLETRIGFSAHDLVGAMGAKTVILTRARRDESGQTVASRFWLRLEALCGTLPATTPDYGKLALNIDQPAERSQLSARPAPLVPAHFRPKTISVTQVDTLKADPYSYYASAVLRLHKLDLVDAEPSPAWRGSLVHAALREWSAEDHFAVGTLGPRLERAFQRENIHPLLAAFWLPKFTQAALWIEAETSARRSDGREPLVWEAEGRLLLHGVILRGRLDRIDRNQDGSLVVLDYKTDAPKSKKAVEAGHALQLGLIGIMAEGGAFAGVEGTPTGFEYWSFAKKNNANSAGYIQPALNKMSASDFLEQTEDHFRDAVEAWLTGDAPFVAKLRPDASFPEFDQLMRYEEWFGRHD